MDKDISALIEGDENLKNALNCAKNLEIGAMTDYVVVYHRNMGIQENEINSRVLVPENKIYAALTDIYADNLRTKRIIPKFKKILSSLENDNLEEINEYLLTHLQNKNSNKNIFNDVFRYCTIKNRNAKR